MDPELWLRAVAGDREAFAAVCRDTWRDLYAFAFWHVQNREEAEDVTQETYARLWQACPGLQSPQHQVVPLLRAIALNVIRDGWRRRRTSGTPVPLHLAPEPPAVDETARAEHRLLVRGLLAELPEDQRMVIELRLLQGYSVRETARAVGKSEAAVRSLQYRGLLKLAERLGSQRS